MDYYRDAYRQIHLVDYEVPYIVIINGVMNDPMYDLWEIMYIEDDYTDSEVPLSISFRIRPYL